jgi:hypothetical protein
VAAARRIGRTVRRGAVGCTWRQELGTTKRAGTSYRGMRMEIWRCARGAGNFTHSACDGTTANNNAVENSVAATRRIGRTVWWGAMGGMERPGTIMPRKSLHAVRVMAKDIDCVWQLKLRIRYIVCVACDGGGYELRVTAKAK